MAKISKEDGPDLNASTAFVYHFLELIKHKLKLFPEGSFIQVEQQSESEEFKIRIMDQSEMDAIKFFGEEFVVPFFTICSIIKKFITFRIHKTLK